MESAVLTGTVQTQARVLGSAAGSACGAATWKSPRLRRTSGGAGGRGERPGLAGRPVGRLPRLRPLRGRRPGRRPRPDAPVSPILRPPGMAGPPLPVARRRCRRNGRRPRRRRVGVPGGGPAHDRRPAPPYGLRPPRPRPRHPPHRPDIRRHPRHPRRRRFRPEPATRSAPLRPTPTPPPHSMTGATSDSARHALAARRGFAACGATPRWLERETGTALLDPAPGCNPLRARASPAARAPPERPTLRLNALRRHRARNWHRTLSRHWAVRRHRRLSPLRARLRHGAIHQCSAYDPRRWRIRLDARCSARRSTPALWTTPMAHPAWRNARSPRRAKAQRPTRRGASAALPGKSACSTCSPNR